jgi:hypothetical protein
MTSPLENLEASGQLHPEPFDSREYDGLVSSGRIRLSDAENPALSLESRFDLAYNAAHALCLAALRRAGFTSCSRSFPRRSAWVLRSGVSSPWPIRSGMMPSTKVLWMLRKGSLTT